MLLGREQLRASEQFREAEAAAASASVTTLPVVTEQADDPSDEVRALRQWRGRLARQGGIVGCYAIESYSTDPRVTH